MARKKSSPGGDLLSLVFLLQAVAMFFTFVSPAIIAALWIVSEVRVLIAKSRLESGIQTLREDLENKHSEVQGLLDQGMREGLELRQDGLFDGRSKMGRSLNSSISQKLDDIRISGSVANSHYKKLAQRSALRSAVFVWAVASAFMWFRNGQTFNSLSFLLAGILATVSAVLVYFIGKESV